MATINKQNVEDIFDITPLQEGLLFHYLKGDSNNSQNFEQICLNMSGKADVELITQAWNAVTRNNEMLRTVFRWKKLSKPIQITLKEYAASLLFEDLSAFPAALQEEKLLAIKKADKAKLFDLEEVPFRVTVAKFSEDRFTLIISNHSIIYDGWSNAILLKEFFTAYLSLLRGQQFQLEAKGKFKDFVKAIRKEQPEKDRAFWSKYLGGKAEKSDLLIRSNNSKELLSTSNCSVQLEAGLVKQVNEFCRNNKITPAALFYATWGILLQKISNSKDVVFGTTVSGRTVDVKGIEGLVGLLINTLPLRVNSKGLTGMELVMKIVDDMTQRTDHEHTPLLKIKEYAGTPLNEDLFDSIVLIENYPLNTGLFKSDPLCKVESFSFDQTNNFDLAVSILTFENAIEVFFGYNNNKYNETTIRTLGVYFSRIIAELVGNPHKQVSQVELVSPQEKAEITETFNATEAPYSAEKFMHQLFEEQVAKDPNKLALVFGNEQMTYGQLNQRAGRLANHLRRFFGDHNVFVPVIMERSPEMIVALMAILKAGYAYVPFEPSLPKARVQKLLVSLNAKLVIADNVTLDHVHEIVSGVEQVEKVMYWNCLNAVSYDKFECIDLSIDAPVAIPPFARTNDDFAYIIYTSGSTGLPKGVMVRHKPVINIIEWINHSFNVKEGDRLLFTTSLGFDLSVYDIFGTLAAGATVCIASREAIGNPQLLIKLILQHKITIWDSAPAAFQQVLQVGTILNESTAGNALRLIMLSGDWISLQLPGLVKRLFEHAKLVSLGGATEAVIWSNYFRVEKVEEHWLSIPYGRPIQNAKYYILDDDLNVMPKGVIGELFIGGECLADGYFNEPKLTSEKFLDSPFGKGKIYRTGDLARFFDDGNIELIGRKDHQLKIRGFRIELGEIESQLTRYPGIKDLAVLIDKNQLGEKYICAFYTSQQEIDAELIKDALRKELPDYMVPSYLIRVQQIPITANGKVDRNSLLKLIADERERRPVKPMTEPEQRIARIWSEILHYDLDKISAYSDFFEIGGHSLNATILQARIEKEFDVQVQLRNVFRYSVLEAFAKCVTAASGATLVIPPAPVQDAYALTSGQKRLYSLQLLNGETTLYNIAGCLKMEGAVDAAKVEAVVKDIIRVQESLRTAFVDINNEIVQVISPEVNFKLHRYMADEVNLEHYVQPFDLSAAPLFRISLIQTEGNIAYLLLDMHHIIADGLSINKFMADFISGYEGKAITAPALQFRDYAVWTNSPAYRERMQEQEKYWLARFSNGVQRLNLPLDFERPAYQTFDGDSLNFSIDSKKAEQLQLLAKNADATMFIVMLSLYNVLLSKMCSQQEVTIGIPVVNRPHADLMNVIGFFVNTLALQNEVEPELPFIDFVGKVRTNSIRAFENQDYPFEHLVANVDARRDPGRNPVFDVALEFDNLDMPAVQLPGLKVEVVTGIINRAKFDLSFGVFPNAAGIQFKIEYNTALFDISTIEWMRDGLLRLIDAVIEDGSTPVDALNIFKLATPAQKEQIEFEF
jgi:fengycin family lipopeptide synthetase D